MSGFNYSLDAEIMELKERLEKAHLTAHFREDSNIGLIQYLEDRIEYLSDLKLILREYNDNK